MQSRPNVVMLVADDHQSTAMHWAGCKAVHTPHLDRLAARGTAFTRAYHMGGCDDAVCVPTRASLLTGMDFYGSMRGGRGVIDPDRVTLPECFKRNGYHSYVTGKWHNDTASLTRSFNDGAAIFAGGMDDHYATPLRSFDPSGLFPEKQIEECKNFATDQFCDTACEFIKDYDREQPFFLYCAFTAPHDPRTPPIDHIQHYKAGQIPVPTNFIPEHPFDLGVKNIRDECLAPYPRTPERIQKELTDYYGMITAMDAGIGRILNALEMSHQLDNTITIYTGDHGLAVGQHGLLGKQNVYEHSARVPFIMAGPNIPVNQVSESLIYSWDCYATLCGLCELETPEGVDSLNLIATLENPRAEHRDSIVNLYMDNQRMITETRWKLIASHMDSATRYQLFDLFEDPSETIDRFGESNCAHHYDRLRSKLARSSVGLPVSSGQQTGHS
ncbi:MAG: sulfatase-like hydrolase/transferase [Lentimonas sp.]